MSTSQHCIPQPLLLATILLSALGLASSKRLTAGEGVESKIDFRQQIQPVLATHCYACHGPDESTREADLRLDDESSAKDYAIVPGDASNSELVSRIFTEDADLIMPPPEARHPLSNDDKQLLKRWIEEGATWQKHWAFEPIASTESSESSPATIDRYIAQQFDRHGLTPSPLADKATLLRRVHLDLVGIPPTPQQLATFVNNPRPDAFEHVVDELLASPHYGEQMAVEWLDVARYADTNGYQNDFVRNMWPWRDWVIQAFNQNLPYDEFIVFQVAGDMLPDPTDEQLIASGFNRNNPSVTEGGTIDEEWRIENCIDRVETTSAAFLGLTMGCARCHDHKYDPVSQQEFYQFFAFFNNVDEQGVYNEKRGNAGPQLHVPTTDETARLLEIAAQIADLQQRLDSQSNDVNRASTVMERWRELLSARDSTTLPQPVYVSNGFEGSELPEGDSPAGPSYEFPGRNNAASTLPTPSFTFERDSPFSWSAWVQGDARGAIFGHMDESDGFRGVDGLILADGRLKVHLIHHWSDNAIAVISKRPFQAGQWTSVSVTYDGGSQASGVRVYFNGEPVELEMNADSLTQSVATEVPFKLGQRSHSEFLTGALADFRLYDRALSQQDINALLHHAVISHYGQLATTGNEAAAMQVCNQYLHGITDDGTTAKLAELQTQHERLSANTQTTMIMRERAGPYRETFLLQRGQYDQPDTSVALMPSIPAALPQLRADQHRNRLGLAKWMIDSRNPLVARVVVNRAWLKFFGRGLVETVGNFGLQGTPPSHPQLLDWLADDFRTHNWDLKRLHKMIVMTATYQRASDLTEESLARDPANQYFARGPRYRMSAEQIRDASLNAAGLLVERVGGPSVFPYQPAGLWEELAGGANNGPYVPSQGDDLYRRSLYTYRKRTVAHPTLATFDAPTWEICQLQRPRTNTPLQSLALLNDVTYVEAARKLAERMLIEPTQSSGTETSLRDSIRHGFVVVTLRQPSASELDVLWQGYQVYSHYYAEHVDDANELLTTGQSRVDPSLPPDRLAAMTSVAAILLNLDEAVTKE